MGKWKKGAKPKGARRWRIKTLIKKHYGKCALCKTDVTLKHNAPDQATIDHMVPICKGGFEDFTNLQLLCRRCNMQRGDTVLDDDGEVLDYDEA